MDNMTTQELNIYDVAKSALGKHMTLDPNVPAYFGCAEALSAVLKAAGFPIQPKGLAGTRALEDWVKSNNLFEQIVNPEAGALLFSSSQGSVHGHCGVVGKSGALGNGKTGVLSNNSDSGLFLELWDLDSWRKYYVETLRLGMTFYRALDHC